MHKMLLEHMWISVHVMIVAYITQCVMYCSVCHLGNLDISLYSILITSIDNIIMPRRACAEGIR